MSSPSQPAHEDDLALNGLLLQAENRLAKLETPLHLSDLPLYLCLGPEGVGKTSVLQNSGLEATLLAGQVTGGGQGVAATRVGNLWMAKRSLFLEVSGRVLNSEPARLTEFIGVLRRDLKKSRFQHFFRRTERALDLRAVLLFLDAREFTGTPEPSKLDRSAQQIRDRLSAVANALATEFPVYVLFTKTDSLAYFPEYFARLRDLEGQQVFGALNPEESSQSSNRVWPEFAAKQFNRQFQSLFTRLTERRLLALTQELEDSRKPAIYEFPREFKKIRTQLVQYLVDVFRPDPLKPIIRLRGFFFTGTRKVERSAFADLESQRAFRPATAPDATQIFSPGMMPTIHDPGVGKPGRGPLVDQWLFARDFFNEVLSRDRPFVRRVRTPGGVRRNVQIATVAVTCAAAFFGLVWTVSWVGNTRLIDRVSLALQDSRRGPDDLSLASLQPLDRLREELNELQQGGWWHWHWGLYTGDTLQELARRVYFDKLKRIALVRINQTLASRLEQAGSNAEKTSDIYDRLKTHRTISVRGCTPDRVTISGTIKAASVEANPGLTPDQTELLFRQLDFYVGDLEKSKSLPVALTEDQAAVEKARDYLRQAGGAEQHLRSLLSQLRSEFKQVLVAQTVDNYRPVLQGKDDYDGVFTIGGRESFEQLVERSATVGGEACVIGDVTGSIATRVSDSNVRERTRSLFYQAYADSWREFLGSYSVIPFSGTGDAAKKLDILSNSSSPLLGIVKLAAVNTNFPPKKPDEPNYWEKAAQTLGLGGLVQGKDKAKQLTDRATNLLSHDGPLMKATDVWRLFQPARFTTPPELEKTVNEKNQAYILGLRGLEQSMENLDRASTNDKGGALVTAQMALAQARMAHKALTDNFSDVGIGLNKQLADLLEQPIRAAARFIPDNLNVLSSAKKNAELAQFCRDMKPILTKYPFAQNDTEATLADISKSFRPGEGLIWKYVQQSAGDLVVQQGKHWQPKPDLQGLKVSADLLTFLERAQQLTNVVFATPGASPGIQYVLRRDPTESKPVKLVLDGKAINTQDPNLGTIQIAFRWPAPTEAQQGADASMEGYGFGKFPGLWGAFRLFGIADSRTDGGKQVTWSYSQGVGKAVKQSLPAPAKIDFVEFPRANTGEEVDLFNPVFFSALQCPKTAVSAN